MQDKTKTRLPAPLSVIHGGRAQLEVEAVAALVDPDRFNLAPKLLARLDRCGKIRLVSHTTLKENVGTTEAESDG